MSCEIYNSFDEFLIRYLLSSLGSAAALLSPDTTKSRQTTSLSGLPDSTEGSHIEGVASVGDVSLRQFTQRYNKHSAQQSHVAQQRNSDFSIERLTAKN